MKKLTITLVLLTATGCASFESHDKVVAKKTSASEYQQGFDYGYAMEMERLQATPTPTPLPNYDDGMEAGAKKAKAVWEFNKSKQP
jgi:predicted transcriptional regulator